MASSAPGSLNPHDWKRVGEAFLQGLVAVVIPYLIAFIPQLDLGSWKPLGMIAVLVLTEFGKRYTQGPQ